MLTGLQGGFTHQPQGSSCSVGVAASSPPYWMMFSSPQQSRLASRHDSDFWEPNPRQRSNSLNPALLCPKSSTSDSKADATTPLPDPVAPSSGRSPRKAKKAFVPDLLNPPACLSSLPHQRRKNLRQCSLSVMDASEQDDPKRDDRSKRNHNIRSNSVTQKSSSSLQKPTLMVRKQDKHWQTSSLVTRYDYSSCIVNLLIE